ncbi:MAG: hypothetical protein U5J64_01755 [Halobacteriales archaeon]|nr:hypothetical protein [Halobacteriales archaeon]
MTRKLVSDDFDEVDELLIAEGVITEEEVREADEWAEEVDIEGLIQTAEPVPEENEE